MAFDPLTGRPLRDTYTPEFVQGNFVPTFSTSTDQTLRDQAQSKGAFLRGYDASRFNTDFVAPIYVEAHKANLAGDKKKYRALRDQAARAELTAQAFNPIPAPTFAETLQDYTQAPEYLGNTLGQVAGSLQEPLVGQGAGLVAGTAAGLLFRNPGLGAKIGAAIGGPVGGFSLHEGEAAQTMYSNPNIADNVPAEEIDRQMKLSAIPNAALDALGLGTLTSGLGKALMRETGEQAVAKEVAKRSAVAPILKGTIAEGGTEGLQNINTQLAEGRLDPSKKLDWNEVVENTAAGAIGGGGFSAPAAGITALQNRSHDSLARTLNSPTASPEKRAEATRSLAGFARKHGFGADDDQILADAEAFPEDEMLQEAAKHIYKTAKSDGKFDDIKMSKTPIISQRFTPTTGRVPTEKRVRDKAAAQEQQRREELKHVLRGNKPRTVYKVEQVEEPIYKGEGGLRTVLKKEQQGMPVYNEIGALRTQEMTKPRPSPESARAQKLADRYAAAKDKRRLQNLKVKDDTRAAKPIQEDEIAKARAGAVAHAIAGGKLGVPKTKLQQARDAMQVEDRNIVRERNMPATVRGKLENAGVRTQQPPAAALDDTERKLAEVTKAIEKKQKAIESSVALLNAAPKGRGNGERILLNRERHQRKRELAVLLKQKEDLERGSRAYRKHFPAEAKRLDIQRKILTRAEIEAAQDREDTKLHQKLLDAREAYEEARQYRAGDKNIARENVKKAKDVLDRVREALATTPLDNPIVVTAAKSAVRDAQLAHEAAMDKLRGYSGVKTKAQKDRRPNFKQTVTQPPVPEELAKKQVPIGTPATRVTKHKKLPDAKPPGTEEIARTKQKLQEIIATPEATELRGYVDEAQQALKKAQYKKSTPVDTLEVLKKRVRENKHEYATFVTRALNEAGIKPAHIDAAFGFDNDEQYAVVTDRANPATEQQKKNASVTTEVVFHSVPAEGLSKENATRLADALSSMEEYAGYQFAVEKAKHAPGRYVVMQAVTNLSDTITDVSSTLHDTSAYTAAHLDTAPKELKTNQHGAVKITDKDGNTVVAGETASKIKGWLEALRQDSKTEKRTPEESVRYAEMKRVYNMYIALEGVDGMEEKAEQLLELFIKLRDGADIEKAKESMARITRTAGGGSPTANLTIRGHMLVEQALRLGRDRENYLRGELSGKEDTQHYKDVASTFGYAQIVDKKGALVLVPISLMELTSYGLDVLNAEGRSVEDVNSRADKLEAFYIGVQELTSRGYDLQDLYDTIELKNGKKYQIFRPDLIIFNGRWDDPGSFVRIHGVELPRSKVTKEEILADEYSETISESRDEDSVDSGAIEEQRLRARARIGQMMSAKEFLIQVLQEKMARVRGTPTYNGLAKQLAIVKKELRELKQHMMSKMVDATADEDSRTLAPVGQDDDTQTPEGFSSREMDKLYDDLARQTNKDLKKAKLDTPTLEHNKKISYKIGGENVEFILDRPVNGGVNSRGVSFTQADAAFTALALNELNMFDTNPLRGVDKVVMRTNGAIQRTSGERFASYGVTRRGNTLYIEQPSLNDMYGALQQAQIASALASHIFYNGALAKYLTKNKEFIDKGLRDAYAEYKAKLPQGHPLGPQRWLAKHFTGFVREEIIGVDFEGATPEVTMYADDTASLGWRELPARFKNRIATLLKDYVLQVVSLWKNTKAAETLSNFGFVNAPAVDMFLRQLQAGIDPTIEAAPEAAPKTPAPRTEPVEVPTSGVNIYSKSTDALGKALTNPTYQKFPIHVEGLKEPTKYKDVESWYKANKSTAATAEQRMQEDYALMVRLITEKFSAYPMLRRQVAERGGVKFLRASTHNVGVKNSRWEGNGTDSAFIRALAEGYEAATADGTSINEGAKSTALAGKSFDIVQLPFGAERPGVFNGHRAGGKNVTNAAPGAPGALGNPFIANDVRGGKMSRAEAVAAFKQAFLRRIDKDPAYKEWVLSLRGKQVGYYKPNEQDIHLHEVQKWLEAQIAPRSKVEMPHIPAEPKKERYVEDHDEIARAMAAPRIAPSNLTPAEKRARAERLLAEAKERESKLAETVVAPASKPAASGTVWEQYDKLKAEYKEKNNERYEEFEAFLYGIDPALTQNGSIYDGLLSELMPAGSVEQYIKDSNKWGGGFSTLEALHKYIKARWNIGEKQITALLTYLDTIYIPQSKAAERLYEEKRQFERNNKDALRREPAALENFLASVEREVSNKLSDASRGSVLANLVDKIMKGATDSWVAEQIAYREGRIQEFKEKGTHKNPRTKNLIDFMKLELALLKGRGDPQATIDALAKKIFPNLEYESDVFVPILSIEQKNRFAGLKTAALSIVVADPATPAVAASDEPVYMVGDRVTLSGGERVLIKDIAESPDGKGQILFHKTPDGKSWGITESLTGMGLNRAVGYFNGIPTLKESKAAYERFSTHMTADEFAKARDKAMSRNKLSKAHTVRTDGATKEFSKSRANQKTFDADYKALRTKRKELKAAVKDISAMEERLTNTLENLRADIDKLGDTVPPGVVRLRKDVLARFVGARIDMAPNKIRKHIHTAQQRMDNNEYSAEAKSWIAREIDLYEQAQALNAARETQAAYEETTARLYALVAHRRDTLQRAIRQRYYDRIAKGTADFEPQLKARNSHFTNLKDTMQKSVEAIYKVRGQEIDVVFEEVFGAAGMSDQKNKLIMLSTLSMDMVGVAFHEAAHDFFDSLSKDGKTRKYKRQLLAHLHKPHIMAQIRKNVAALGEGAISQLDPKDPHYQDEVLAYAFQFYTAGILDLKAADAKGMFGKLYMSLLRIFRIASTTGEHFESLFQAMQEGKLQGDHSYNSITKAIAAHRTFSQRIDSLSTAVEPIGKILAKSATTRLRALNSPALDNIAELFHSETSGKLGFLKRRNRMTDYYLNKLATILQTSTEEEKAVALANMQSRKEPSSKLEKDIAALQDELFNYMKARGVKRLEYKDHEPVWQNMRKVTNYFPRKWDVHSVIDNRDRLVSIFSEMMAEQNAIREASGKSVDTTNQTEPDILVDNLITTLQRVGQVPDGQPDGIGEIGFNPRHPYVNEAAFSFISKENAHRIVPFLDKNLDSTLAQYIYNSTHRAEYTAVFGLAGAKIRDALTQARAEGLNDDEIEDATRAITAMDGTLVKDLDPLITIAGKNYNWRTAQLFAMTAQNFILLPLNIFTQQLDIIGPAIRSNSLNEAWNAFKISWKQVGKAAFRNSSTTRDEEYALTTGIIRDDMVADMFNSVDRYQGITAMQHTLQRRNTQFFKMAGVEAWTRGLRIAAIGTAQRFFIGNKDNARYMAEFGLKETDIHEIAGGRMALNREQLIQAGLTEKEAIAAEARINDAMYSFVDQSVLRPDPATRPVWMSDPRLALLAQFKNFTFAFHNVILKNVARELAHGNRKPLFALLAAVPIIMIADLMRGSIRGTTDIAKLSLGELLWNSTQRAGILGHYQFALDAMQDPMYGHVPGYSFAGPAFDHLNTVTKDIAEGIVNDIDGSGEGFTTRLAEAAERSLPLIGSGTNIAERLLTEP